MPVFKVCVAAMHTRTETWQSGIRLVRAPTIEQVREQAEKAVIARFPMDAGYSNRFAHVAPLADDERQMLWPDGFGEID